MCILSMELGFCYSPGSIIDSDSKNSCIDFPSEAETLELEEKINKYQAVLASRLKAKYFYSKAFGKGHYYLAALHSVFSTNIPGPPVPIISVHPCSHSYLRAPVPAPVKWLALLGGTRLVEGFCELQRMHVCIEAQAFPTQYIVHARLCLDFCCRTCCPNGILCGRWTRAVVLPKPSDLNRTVLKGDFGMVDLTSK
ncbi:hypothetical protein GUJ93_ZPchr0010g8162 [Zizania palustris]|uniref:Uncharacterized protein n=1 Tax=Zizania palustris TaxID=103762 RepID=A0A8J6BL94_ZIZPA|nr:hypothetical protein GUJ93_ZPchr0010g8162 [Zizania palustris]